MVIVTVIGFVVVLGLCYCHRCSYSVNQHMKSSGVQGRTRVIPADAPFIALAKLGLRRIEYLAGRRLLETHLADGPS